MKNILLLIISFQLYSQSTSYSVDINEGCAPLNVNFTNTSNISVWGFQVYYVWDYGDGTPVDTTFHTSHIYTYGRDFYATLRVYRLSNNQYLSYHSKIIKVHGAGKNVAVSKNRVCPNEPITIAYYDLNWQSIRPINIRWDFGDGNYVDSITNFMNYIYQLPGTYNIGIIISTHCDTKILTLQIEIDTTLIPNFSIFSYPVNGSCPNAEINFSNNSAFPLYNYQWNFGDGNYSDSLYATHFFADTGNYVVTFTAQNSCGNTNSDTIIAKIDTIYSFPQVYAYHYPASFTNPYCKNDSVWFGIDGAFFGVPKFQNYLWDFGDGELEYIENPRHLYNDSGTYSGFVRLSQCNKDSTIYFNVRILNCINATENFDEIKNEINLYPNPLNKSDNLIIETTENSFLEIFDLIGNRLNATKLLSSTNQIDLSELPSGIFIYSIQTNNKSTIKRGKLVIN